ncbi:uncharacterized protein Dmul_04440 [Desulfococcus multivorans]|nr:uncharacterized protein Dmul_04440 [Desulfococcus multivorans]
MLYKTPWKGDPRITIQNHKGKAKADQAAFPPVKATLT